MISRMKKKHVPLHVSQARIHAERANVVLRTQKRIAILHVAAQQDRIAILHETKNWHCCINTICFCVMLVLLNFLFLQWLYYKPVHLKQL